MITTEEALCFLKDVLGMTSPSTKLETNRKDFLKDFIVAWLDNIPYQTVTGIATPQPNRHLPTLLEIKRDVFGKYGGLCYQQNVCCYMVLKALNFDVSMVPCDIGFPSNHVGIIVHNLTDVGSDHYVDVGSGNPTFRAVPLDFDQESFVYHDSFLSYKFTRQDDVITRLHKVEGHPGREGMHAERIKDGWYEFITMHFKKHVDISHFEPSMTKIYTVVVPIPPFLSSVRCMAWPNGRFVCIKDSTLLKEDEEGHVQKSYSRNRDDIKAAFARHFPQFPESMVDDAMDDEFVEIDFEKDQS